jgi:RHS repeat-associated protein
MVTPPAGGGSPTTVNDFYQLGHLANQTNGAGTLLASYTYDNTGAPVSVQVGSDPASAPRYWYVYNAHGDVVSLVDASGATVASYAYDSWGNLLAGSSESIPNANGWVNPYRYDGRDGARYDASDGLYWLSVRVYDPTLGRFLSRDPLGRAPLFLPSGNDNPYVYAGNNPLSNVDPSGQMYTDSAGGGQPKTAKSSHPTRAQTRPGNPKRGAPTLYESVLGICGRLSGMCSVLIQKLGGPQILGNKALLRNVGVVLMIAGAALDFIDAIYTLINAADKGRAIGYALATLGFVTAIISDLSNSTMSKQQIGVAMVIGAAVDAFAALLETAAAIYLQWGIWGEVAVDASVTVATTAAEGEAAPAMSILNWLGGNVITYALGAMGSGLASIGQSLIAVADRS